MFESKFEIQISVTPSFITVTFYSFRFEIGIRNLIHRLPNGWGSHKYQGEWRYIDQVFLLADAPWEVKKLKLLKFDHLLTDDKGQTGQRPKRTHRGLLYEGGLSDHLPLLLKLVYAK